MGTELTDKVCWLLSQKVTAFVEIRGNCLKLLMALISPDTIDRIVLNLKGKIKTLILDRDVNLVFGSLKLLHKVLEYDTMKRILDFELVQNLVINLDHANTKIFNETVDLLSHNQILEDNTYLKVIFNSDSLNRMIQIFPSVSDIPKVNFYLIVIFEFTFDPKTAGTLMAMGGTDFYKALVNFKLQEYKFIEWRQKSQTNNNEDSTPTSEIQFKVRTL